MSGVQGRSPFNRLISALEPWLDQVVIVGGWAHQLYRLHPSAHPLDYPPLTTLDTDIAVPAKLPAGEQNIRERLQSHGFAGEFFGDDRPPATHYLLSGESSGFYAEFLTPLTGSDDDRQRKRKATIEVAGISSQRLRHIDILLSNPWPVQVETFTVRVANPVTFLAQKILIHSRRERHDRAKDILYMHDTLEIFGARLSELQQLWRDDVAAQLHHRNSSAVTKAGEMLFGDLSDDVRRAAAISAERGLTPQAIRQACRYGLSELFTAQPA